MIGREEQREVQVGQSVGMISFVWRDWWETIFLSSFPVWKQADYTDWFYSWCINWSLIF